MPETASQPHHRRPLPRLVLAALVVVAAPPAGAEGHGRTDILARLARAQAAWQGVRDYSCVLHKQERIDGELRPAERIQAKFRLSPRSVYMRWLGPAHEGREALLVTGRNGDRVKVHEGGLLGILTLDLDPNGAMAMRDSRHPVTEAGIGFIMEQIGADLALAEARGEGEVEALGPRDLEGERLECYRARFPAGKVRQGPAPEPGRYYSGDITVCLSPANGLPVAVTSLDGAGNLLEHYAYTGLRLNAGLGDADFDPGNPGYGF